MAGEPGEPTSRGAPGATLVLVTGFGPFERFRENPSEVLARELAARPPAGAEVVAAVLPVSFARAPEALDACLAELRPRVPDLFVGLGAMREPGYRLELRARPASRGRARVDADGCTAAEVSAGPGPELRTRLEPWLRSFAAGAAGFRISDYAGGYVCERLYHRLLLRADALDRPGVFLHVPPVRHAAPEEQSAAVRGFLAALLEAHALGRAG